MFRAPCAHRDSIARHFSARAQKSLMADTSQRCGVGSFPRRLGSGSCNVTARRRLPFSLRGLLNAEGASETTAPQMWTVHHHSHWHVRTVRIPRSRARLNNVRRLYPPAGQTSKRPDQTGGPCPSIDRHPSGGETPLPGLAGPPAHSQPLVVPSRTHHTEAGRYGFVRYVSACLLYVMCYVMLCACPRHKCARPCA